MLTPPYMAAVGGQIVTIAMPVKKNGELLGVVGGDLSLQTLVKIINSVDFGGIGHAFLVSGDGQVIVSPDEDQVMKNLKDIYPGTSVRIEKLTRRSSSKVRTASCRSRLSAVCPVLIGISVCRSIKTKPMHRWANSGTSALIAMLIAVVAIAVLLSLLIQVLLRPLTTMGIAMQDIAQGEGDLTRRLTVTSKDEFGEVGSAFNRFVETYPCLDLRSVFGHAPGA